MIVLPETSEIPGAKATDILTLFPFVLTDYPNIKTVVVPIGCNHIADGTPEIFKSDFRSILTALTNSGNDIVVSGLLAL